MFICIFRKLVQADDDATKRQSKFTRWTGSPQMPFVVLSKLVTLMVLQPVAIATLAKDSDPAPAATGAQQLVVQDPNLVIDQASLLPAQG